MQPSLLLLLLLSHGMWTSVKRHACHGLAGWQLQLVLQRRQRVLTEQRCQVLLAAHLLTQQLSDALQAWWMSQCLPEQLPQKAVATVLRLLDWVWLLLLKQGPPCVLRLPQLPLLLAVPQLCWPEAESW